MTVVTNEVFTEEINKLRSAIEVEPTIVVDVETNGLDPFGVNQICGIGIGQPSNSLCQYYPFRHHLGENLPLDNLVLLMDLLNHSVKQYIGYNLKFDLHFLEKDGLSLIDKKLIDVIVMVRLVEHSDIKDLALTPTAKRNYGDGAVQYDIDTKKQLRSNKWNKDFSMAPPSFLGEYCKKDVALTAKIYNDYLRKIKKTDQMGVFDFENDLTSVLYTMEKRGVAIDTKYAQQSEILILDRQEQVKQEIYKLAGKEFNISSPAQIGEIFTEIGIESPVKTPKGQDSWSEAALVNINHRMAGLVRQFRTLDKLRSTYIEPYKDIEVMHTSFCNWGTATGRLSSRDPNLQNIPRNHFKLKERTLNADEKAEVLGKIAATVSAKGGVLNGDLSDEVLNTWSFVGDESYNAEDNSQISIRRLFIPRPKYSLVGFDYSQMEVRVFMSYFRNETIDEILNKDDVDFHSEAAKLAFSVDESSEKFKEYRQAAKAITFGTIYGIGNKKLAQQLSTTPKEAGRYKKQYFEGMKGSKEFFDKVVATVTARGWIKNRYGRHYRIDPKFAYKGVNYLVQGTSADLLSERMLEVDKYLQDKESNLLLQVHDEIICEIHDSELETVPYKIRDILEINTLEIPLKVDMEIFQGSWAVKKDLKPLTFDDLIDWD
tara:strand:- start:292 stop:2259 length:1968 start_codon:yes stop_codon:yes gene_type:complete